MTGSSVPTLGPSGSTSTPEYTGISDIPPNATSVTINGITIKADTHEHLLQILEFVCMRTGKALSDIHAFDLNQAFVDESGNMVGNSDITDIYTAARDANGVATYTFQPFAIQVATASNSKEFFGSEPPMFPQGSDRGMIDDPSLIPTEGIAGEAYAAGVSGMAHDIYSANYPNPADDKPVDESKLPPDTAKLCHDIFGPGPITQGQLNVLKLMGLVQGDTSNLGSWALTAQGQKILTDFNITPAGNPFLPDAGLLDFPQGAATVGDNAGNYFNADGSAFAGPWAEIETKDGPTKGQIKGVAQLRSDAATTLQSLDTSNPDGKNSTQVVDDESSRTVLNQLFGLDSSNNSFTNNQINTAISLGLIRRNPDGSFSATLRGSTFGRAAGAGPVTSPDQTPEQRDQIEFDDAMHTLSDQRAIDIMDGLEPEKAGEGIAGNGRFGNGMWLLAGMSDADLHNDALWNKYAQPTTYEERVKMRTAAGVAIAGQNADRLRGVMGLTGQNDNDLFNNDGDTGLNEIQMYATDHGGNIGGAHK